MHELASRHAPVVVTIGKSDVQCPHLVALIGIVIKHIGHSFVVGSAAAAGLAIVFFTTAPRNFTMMMNTVSEMMRKLISSPRNCPYLMGFSGFFPQCHSVYFTFAGIR